MIEAALATHVAWAAPLAGSLLAFLGMLLRVRSELYYSLVASLSILVSAIATSWLAWLVLAEEAPLLVPGPLILESPRVSLDVRADGVSVVVALVASWIGFIISVYSREYMRGDEGYGRFFALLSLFVGGMMLLALADSLVVMFAGWEATGLCSYALISHWYENPPDKWVGRPGRYRLGFPMFFPPTESGTRALAFTMIGDAWLLAGIATLIRYTGTSSLTELAASAGVWMLELSGSGALAVIAASMTIGALAKSAQIPFHEWLLTAMTAPTPVSALIHAATMVNAGVYLFLRIAGFTLEAVAASAEPPALLASVLVPVYAGVLAVGLATSLLTSLIALNSDELKVVLAASTSSQLGLMFASASASGLLALWGRSGEALVAFYATLLHLLSHAVFKAALFLAAGWVIHASHTRFIEGMRGALREARAAALAMTLGSLSLAGIPPTLGFFSKDLVLHSLAWSSPALAPVGLALAVLTALYAGKTLGALLGSREREALEENGHSGEPPAMSTAYLSLALASLALGLSWPASSKLVARAVEASLSAPLPEIHLSLGAAALASVASLSALAIAIVYGYRGARVTSWLASSSVFKALSEIAYDRFLMSPVLYALARAMGTLGEFVARTVHNFAECATIAFIDGFASDIRARPSTRELEHRAWLSAYCSIDRLTCNLCSRVISYLANSTVDTDQALDNLYHRRVTSTVRTLGNRVRLVLRGSGSQYFVLAYILSVLAVAIVLLAILLGM
ncbi:MAG: NADH-quinone oxidoreductase subunit L [Acidilobaceae archaeon]